MLGHSIVFSVIAHNITKDWFVAWRKNSLSVFHLAPQCNFHICCYHCMKSTYHDKMLYHIFELVLVQQSKLVFLDVLIYWSTTIAYRNTTSYLNATHSSTCNIAYWISYVAILFKDVPCQMCCCQPNKW